MIKVTLTNDIFKKISAIDENRFLLGTVELPTITRNKLRKNSKKKSSYASNKIEGNPLTEKQANDALESDSHKHFLKPEQEIRNYYSALTLLEEKLKNKTPFSRELVLEVQAIVEKGASKEIADRLENGMLNYKSVLDKKYSINSQSIVGGGAAGGLGTALKVFLKGKMQSGIDAMLDLANFDSVIDGASFVITGEGRIDSQSVDGKVISGILKRTSKKQIPTFAIVGSVGNGADKAYEMGLNGIYSLIDTPSSLEEILKSSQTLYAKTAESLFRTIKSLTR